MAQPQRRTPARKPTVLKSKKFHVRLWEIERKKGATPVQLRGFDVEADAIHKARDKVSFELTNTRRRVVRSLSMQTDGTFTAVVFKNEVRKANPTQPNEWPLKRDAAGQRSTIAAAHTARRAAARKRAETSVVDIAEARAKRKVEHRKKVAEARKKEGEAARRRQKKEAAEAVEAREAARQARKDERAKARAKKAKG